MNILFVVERPTQFEAPFYRHAAQDQAHQLRVLFTSPDPASPVFDPELGHRVDWGIDLLGGYPHEELSPHDDRREAALRALKRERWELVITNGHRDPAARQATAMARQLGIATALRLDSVDRRSGVGAAVRRRLLAPVLGRRYDLFLGVGSRSLAYLERCGIGAARRGLFPYAVDVEYFRGRSGSPRQERAALRQRWGIPGGAKVVLAVAKLNDREAPWDLVAALPSLGPDVWLLVAGDGPARNDVLELARKLQPDQRFCFCNYVPYPELPALYAAADLFVHAVREEKWGVSVNESLACGLPAIVSSGVGAGDDLIAAGRNGFVYETGNVEELARRIAAALALSRDEVRRTNDQILARWDYAATWQHLLEAAARAARVKRGSR
jgi:glycosyltransferase involved in cell wall biosynthesis